MNDQQSNLPDSIDFDWMSSTYEEQLNFIVNSVGSFSEIDSELKNYIFMFLVDQIRTHDLLNILRTNKNFREFYKSILDYLFSSFEDLIEDEDIYDKYIEIRVSLFVNRSTGRFDPQDKFLSILNDSERRHTWNDFGITGEVIEDFDKYNFYDYDAEIFNKFRDLTRWLILDILEYFDTLDTVQG